MRRMSFSLLEVGEGGAGSACILIIMRNVTEICHTPAQLSYTKHANYVIIQALK